MDQKTKSYKEILTKIENNDTITIFGHVSPDGDCFGSQIALKEALRLRYPNKRIFAFGKGLKEFSSLIGEVDTFDEETIKNSLAIVVDCNDLSRIEEVEINSAKEFAKIDHHVENHLFTQGPFIVKEDANSCCEIILDFLRHFDFEINKKAANALYLGILTDTGRFQYVSDYRKAFLDAAFLVEKGARPEIINSILNITKENLMAFKGYIYSNYKKTKDGVVYIVLEKEILSFFNIDHSTAGSMVNLLSNINGYPIWAFFSAMDETYYHAEFRSSGPHVQPVALKYGGGGHLHAAGVTLTDLPNCLDSVLADLDEAIRQYKGEK